MHLIHDIPCNFSINYLELFRPIKVVNFVDQFVLISDIYLWHIKCNFMRFQSFLCFKFELVDHHGLLNLCQSLSLHIYQILVHFSLKFLQTSLLSGNKSWCLYLPVRFADENSLIVMIFCETSFSRFSEHLFLYRVRCHRVISVVVYDFAVLFCQKRLRF